MLLSSEPDVPGQITSSLSHPPSPLLFLSLSLPPSFPHLQPAVTADDDDDKW